ncbi:MAG: tyrosine-type recombinase/integrase [Candidatus Aenigmatarchaeota archaeon]
MEKLDIHKTESTLKSINIRIGILSESNKKNLTNFYSECLSRGISNNRTIFYLAKLLVIIKNTGRDLDSLDYEEIKNLVTTIESNKSYKEWTKASYKIAIKKFYKWLEFGWDSKVYPSKVSWIKARARKSKLDDPIVLTKEEVLRIFKAANGLREKALASFLYESGCRAPDELLNLRIKDVEFNDSGAKVRLHSGKVGYRTILVVSCVPHLKAWIENEHPSPKPDSYVWTRKGSSRVIAYNSLQKMINRWRKNAGIDKHITPYTFRRTRYTHLASKIPTPVLYKYMGQVLGSKVIDRYVSLSGEDTDEAILSFYGIVAGANHDIKPMFCSRCNKQNPPELEYCSICNSPLTEKAKVEVEEKRTLEIKDLVELLIQKRLGELKKEGEKK